MAVIARRANPFGEIKVVRNRKTGVISYCQGSWYQSRADRSGISLIGYVHAIYGLILGAGAHRVLVVGGAGGTLASMLSRAGKRVTMVDIDPDAFGIARDFFNLASDVVCEVADGRDFIARSRAHFDAIVVDAYSRGTAPPHLCTVEFFRLVRRRLRPGGMILFNAVVASDADPAADQIAAGLSAADLPVRILDVLGEAHRNTVVLAGVVRRCRRPRLLVKPDTMAEEIDEELSEMIFRAPRPCDYLEDAMEPAAKAANGRRWPARRSVWREAGPAIRARRRRPD